MLRRLLRDLALVLVGALAGLALLEQFNPRPPAVVIAAGIVGMKPEPAAFAARPAAAPAYPDDARPVLQHCYPIAPASPIPTVVIGRREEPVA